MGKSRSLIIYSCPATTLRAQRRSDEPNRNQVLPLPFQAQSWSAHQADVEVHLGCRGGVTLPAGRGQDPNKGREVTSCSPLSGGRTQVSCGTHRDLMFSQEFLGARKEKNMRLSEALEEVRVLSRLWLGPAFGIFALGLLRSSRCL